MRASLLKLLASLEAARSSPLTVQWPPRFYLAGSPPIDALAGAEPGIYGLLDEHSSEDPRVGRVNKDGSREVFTMEEFFK